MGLLAATEPALPALLRPLLDGSFVNGNGERWLIPALIVLVFLVRGIMSFTSDVSTHWVANKVVMDLRHEMFRNLLLLPSKFYEDNSSGEVLSKFTYDVAQVAQAATRCLTVLVKDALAILGLLAYMVYLAWELAFVALFIGSFVGFIVIGASRRMRETSREVQRSMGAVTQVAQETIDCHKAVKVFAGQTYEGGRFQEAIDQARQFAMKVVVVSAANVPIIQLVTSIGLAVMVYWAAMQAAAGEMTVGEFVSFFIAMTLLLPPIKRLTGINEHIQRGLAAAASVFELMDAKAEPDAGTVHIGRARGELRFENVSLNYRPGHPDAISGVSVEVSAGETVALIGASGSGKSTMVNLVPRFHHPTSGRILLDGVDIEELSLTSLRANISLVSQEVLLFNDTVRNNIAYGDLRKHSERDILEAAEAAHALEFIQRMPEGMDSVIGEEGVRLSGGQRQRLAIARALLKDAPILVLDEATSALDSVSERHIQAALETLRVGRTCIVIAHRLSTIKNVDRIIVMKHGRIVECGTHSELVRQKSVYSELHGTRFAATCSKAVGL